jgi:UrcA family protein
MSGIRATVVPVLAFLLSAYCQAAAARQPVLVSYSDLDVSTHAGATEMYARVTAAAATACAPERDSRSGRSTVAYQLCVNATVASTVYRAAIPNLRALYQTRTGRVPRE